MFPNYFFIITHFILIFNFIFIISHYNFLQISIWVFSNIYFFSYSPLFLYYRHISDSMLYLILHPYFLSLIKQNLTVRFSILSFSLIKMKSISGNLNPFILNIDLFDQSHIRTLSSSPPNQLTNIFLLAILIKNLFLNSTGF